MNNFIESKKGKTIIALIIILILLGIALMFLVDGNQDNFDKTGNKIEIGQEKDNENSNDMDDEGEGLIVGDSLDEEVDSVDISELDDVASEDGTVSEENEPSSDTQQGNDNTDSDDNSDDSGDNSDEGDENNTGDGSGDKEPEGEQPPSETKWGPLF